MGDGASASRLSLLPLTPDFEARLASLDAALASVSLLAPLSGSQILKMLAGSSRRKSRVPARRHNHFSLVIVHRRGK